MKKFLLLLVALVMLAIGAQSVFAVGYSNKPITGTYESVTMCALTVSATPVAITLGETAFVRPYDLPATLDLVVSMGTSVTDANKQVYKIVAAAGNINTEFGPFNRDESDSNLKYYLSLTTSAAPAASCTVYQRVKRPCKHNY